MRDFAENRSSVLHAVCIAEDEHAEPEDVAEDTMALKRINNIRPRRIGISHIRTSALHSISLPTQIHHLVARLLQS